MIGMAVNWRTGKPRLARGAGGLSGPAIRPIALRLSREVVEAVEIPVIGCGGISSPEDALEFLIAGATTVGVGTSLFYDPLVCGKINTGIAEYLAANGMASVRELVGSLDAPKRKVEACSC